MEDFKYTTEKQARKSLMKTIMEFLKKNATAASIVGFCIAVIAVLCVAVWILKEYVVSVCILIVLEVAMAALLHNVELWKHGALLGAQFLVAAAIHRIALIGLCVVVYVAAIIALQFIRNKSES